MLLAIEYLPRMVGDSYVLIPVGQNVLRGEGIIKLNEFSYFILKELEDTERSLEDILTSVYTEFEVSEEEKSEVEKTVEGFLEEAIRKGLVYRELPHGFRFRNYEAWQIFTKFY